MSKRQLNIIYFVDSSRTRTIKLPLGRVSVLLLLFAAVALWSVGSAFLLNGAYEERADLTKKLRTSLATVFDYETRFDGVYDVAYPSGKATPASTVALAKPQPAAKPTPTQPVPSVASALSKLPAEEPSGTVDEVDAAADGGESIANAPTAIPPQATPAAKPVPRARELPENAAAMQAKALAEKTEGASGAPIVVGNPVIENGSNALLVKFDLTNKSAGRAEGYIWAVAAFKDEKGATTFIADPPNVGVQADGDVADVTKSSNFGIRKFKKMSFSFPVGKELNGTFTGIKIGVTDKSGANRTTYNVPVEIKVGQAEAEPEGTNR